MDGGQMSLQLVPIQEVQGQSLQERASYILERERQIGVKWFLLTGSGKTWLIQQWNNQGYENSEREKRPLCPLHQNTNHFHVC